MAVVIPTRNRWPLLRTALAGALAQRGVNVEVVVVDDGSSDETAAGLATLDEPRLTVLRLDEGRGVALARNRGLAEVSAPWVAFLDDDDVWAPGHLAAMLDAVGAAGADPRRIGLVYSGHVEVDWARRVIGVSRAAPVAGVPEHLDRFNLIGGPSRVLLRTDAVRAAGAFDPAFSTVADWDLWVRVAADWELAACDELLVGYMRHPESMSFDADRLLAEIVTLREKHGWQASGPSGPWPGDTLAFHVALTYRAAGHRFRAARWYVRSYAARRDPRDLARAVGVLLGERAIRRSGLGLRERLGPDVGPWLEDVRRAEDGSWEGLPFAGAPPAPPHRRRLMGYAILDLEATRPLPELALAHDQDGVLVLLRAHGRPVHQALHALAPGACLDPGQLAVLLGRPAAQALVEEAVRAELQPAAPARPVGLTVAVCTRARPDLLAACLDRSRRSVPPRATHAASTCSSSTTTRPTTRRGAWSPAGRASATRASRARARRRAQPRPRRVDGR